MAPTVGQQSVMARLKSGGAWALLGKLSATLLAFLISALLARMLPAGDVGAYFFIANLVVFLVAVAQFGLPLTTVRLIAGTARGHEPQALASLLRSILGMALLACALTVVLFFVATHFLAGRVAGFDAVLAHRGTIAVWMTAMAIGGLLAESFRGLHDIRLATIFGAVLSALLFYLFLLAAWFGAWSLDLDDVLNLGLVAVLASLSGVVIAAVLRFGLLQGGCAAGREPLARVAAVTLPVWGVNVLSFALSQLDVIFLGMFRQGEEVAVYGAVTRLVALVTMTLVAVNQVIAPVIAELHAQGRRPELENLLRRSATLAGVPSIILLAVFALGGDRLLGLVYGDAYAGGVLLLVVLSLGQMVNVWTGSCGMTLLMTGHQKMMLSIMFVCGCSTLLAAAMLAPVSGAAGVAVAIAIGTALQNIAMMLAVKSRIGIWTCMDTAFLPRRLVARLRAGRGRH
jgi:O-antigen/teichoic acid export membrane protein